jgi:VCBS repeat-containing protein
MPKDKVQFKAHAQDDSATTTENQFVVIDVLANDRGSAATIYSLDQSDPTNEFRSAILPSGASVQTTGIQHMVVYKPGNGFDYLAEGETATDSFTYTIRLEDGSYSTATIDVLITGTNDPAVIPSTFVRLTEGDSAEDISTSGTLSISDVDSPELFVAGTQEGSFGTFTIEEDGDWTYTASSAHDEFQDTNEYGEVFFVESVDGTTSYVQIHIMGTGNEPEMAAAHSEFAF